ncbi:Protein kinase domain-containing protein [Mycena indigotica]|uniref:Protein kinase domain-containing protein n=1 Tax=Mycena indigotica TaxID=2126181 RepID=A0A8H6T974_9AGAR|nr:Protein kinase domain-containing protein [Mycena indigotica]KAF7312521.1 Protein kinase domain-containing protein [Mycena indigotica]
MQPEDLWWAARRIFLEDSGYRLRPKFHPDYEPDPNAFWYTERETHIRPTIMDVTRISDGRLVMLKAVSTRVHPHEVEIACLFSSPPLSEDPRNHCIPILEVLQDPDDADLKIIVMPRLIRMAQPLFETVGEVVDAFRQIFEGIEFMHENFVAHRDCSMGNIVQDPTLLYPAGFHPIYTTQDPTNSHRAPVVTRTKCWPRYFVIDFGLSRRYDPSEGPPAELTIRGLDQSPPEHNKPPWVCNPFPTDIYFLGNTLKHKFLFSKWAGKQWVPLVSLIPPVCADLWLIMVLQPSLRFLEPLINDMIQEDPAMRPTIGEVIERFNALCNPLSQWHLRRPGQTYSFHWYLLLMQITRTLRRVPPVPPYRPRLNLIPLSQSLRDFYTQTPVVPIEKEAEPSDVTLDDL